MGNRKLFCRRIGSTLFIAFIINFSFLGLANASSGNLDQTSSDLLSTVAGKVDQQGISYVSSGDPLYYNSSVTGKAHIFLHYQAYYERLSDPLLYHIYELNNGSWSEPKLAFGYEECSSLGILDEYGNIRVEIMGIRQSDIGFVLYIKYRAREKIGLSAIEFNEESKEWLDQQKIFGTDDMEDYMDPALIGGDLIINSLYLGEEKTLYLTWSYNTVDPKTTIYTHVVTKIGEKNVFESQEIAAKSKYMHNNFPPMFFYKDNNTLNLYDSNLLYRVILFPNGSWSKWENATLSSKHGYYPDWFPNPWSDSIFIGQRYFFARHSYNLRAYFLMYDLAQGDRIRAKNLGLPYSPYYTDDFNYFIGFELNVSTTSEEIFAMGLLNNETLELWQYHSTNNAWKQISTLEVDKGPLMINCEDYYSLELEKSGNNWKVFWREICTGMYIGVRPTAFIGNLYTASYNIESKNWSPAICIMNTSTISSDYEDYIQDTVPTLEYPIFLLSIIAIVFIRRKVSHKD